ncbi:hypothetical protein FB446DRAFT_707261, partial [Lentinula raphanica]
MSILEYFDNTFGCLSAFKRSYYLWSLKSGKNYRKRELAASLTGVSGVMHFSSPLFILSIGLPLLSYIFVMPKQKNQHRPNPPKETLRDVIEQFWRLSIADTEAVELLKEYYDTDAYGL